MYYEKELYKTVYASDDISTHACTLTNTGKRGGGRGEGGGGGGGLVIE